MKNNDSGFAPHFAIFGGVVTAEVLPFKEDGIAQGIMLPDKELSAESRFAGVNMILNFGFLFCYAKA